MLHGPRWQAGGDLRAFATRCAILGLWIGGLALAFMTVSYYLTGHRLVGDGHAYWLTGQSWFRPYAQPPNTKDAYLYSPAFAQLISPLTHLPWPAFASLWVCAETTAFLWLLRPLGWRWALPLVLWCTPELVIGNVLGFIAVALVLAIAHPAAWSAMLLTKPTFGVGALWHLARGEWRRFAIAASVTCGIAVVSFAIEPTLWKSWVHFLLAHSGESIWFFPGRLAVAVALVIIAARTRRPWLLAVALVFATPVLAGSPSLTVLAAVPRLLASDAGRDQEGPEADARASQLASDDAAGPAGQPGSRRPARAR